VQSGNGILSLRFTTLQDDRYEVRYKDEINFQFTIFNFQSMTKFPIFKLVILNESEESRGKFRLLYYKDLCKVVTGFFAPLRMTRLFDICILVIDYFLVIVSCILGYCLSYGILHYAIASFRMTGLLATYYWLLDTISQPPNL